VTGAKTRRRHGRARLIIAALALTFAGRAFGGAEEDWQKIIQLDAGPQPGTEITDVEQARRVTLAHLATQQAAYDDFLKKYPADPHGVDLRLRLAHLYSVRADLQRDPKARAEAAGILDKLAKDPALPKERVADVEFARVALFMRSVNPASAAARDALTTKVLEFKSAFPGDRRVAPLLVELATLYDSQPIRKRSLLLQAEHLATDPETKGRAADDLKRLALLGKPLEMKFQSVQGETIDPAACRGRVVAIFFYADWSPPAMETLDRIAPLARKYAGARAQFIAVSLDQQQSTAAAALKARGIDCPLVCDGKGWDGPAIREPGINALPLVWLLDKRGVLRELNSADDCETRMRELLKAD
jgi:peroxiredoxin